MKLKSCGNLVRMVEELNTGKNNVLEVYEYKYWDNTYYMRFGHDIIADSAEARTEIQALKKEELAHTERE